MTGVASPVARSPLEPSNTPPRDGRSGSRQEALAGYAFIAVPMALFLVLQIGMLAYAAWISVWDWNILRRPRGIRRTRATSRSLLSDPIFLNAVKNILYYTVVWVPLTMAVGLFLAVIVNQKIRGQTFFRAAFYFPAIASSAAITIAVALHRRARRPLQRDPRRARAQPPLRAARLRRRTTTGSATTRRR